MLDSVSYYPEAGSPKVLCSDMLSTTPTDGMLVLADMRSTRWSAAPAAASPAIATTPQQGQLAVSQLPTVLLQCCKLTLLGWV